MACYVEIDLVYGHQSDEDPGPEDVAQAAARLARPTVKHLFTYSRTNDEGIAEPTIDVEDSRVAITLEVEESRKGTVPRLGWIINELIAGLMRERVAEDRPDLVLDPESVVVRLVKR